MKDKQRAEFEKWAKQFEIDLTPSKHIGTYSDLMVNNYWKVWQAAIASVVVELPKIYFDPYGDERTQASESGKEIIIDEVKCALEKAGIRYE